MKTVIITGAAGFIGFHLSKLMLSQGWRVIGVDSMSRYYDVKLKYARLRQLNQNQYFIFKQQKIEIQSKFQNICIEYPPDAIIHLAAQAGVRYSIDNPEDYVETNLVGTFKVLEAARRCSVDHLLMASTSSVYGANEVMPFHELQKTDHQMSFYAATKKSNEVMAHSYSHIFNIPITMFRFFTVYGPWGRPDMALFKFTDAIIKDEPIDVYNYGDMKRDFTYVEDLVRGIFELVKVPPKNQDNSQDHNQDMSTIDSLSPVAPWRVVNIGNSSSVKLMDYIEALEQALGKTAQKNYLPMQAGDVPCTLASTELLGLLTEYSPSTSVQDGVRKFVDWYLDYHQLTSR